MIDGFLLEKKLNKNIPIPLYYQLKELLMEYISVSDENTPLPTESQLCEHFQVSRSTVRQTLGELTSDGFLVRHKGKGTMILPCCTREFQRRDAREGLHSPYRGVEPHRSRGIPLGRQGLEDRQRGSSCESGALARSEFGSHGSGFVLPASRIPWFGFLGHRGSGEQFPLPDNGGHLPCPHRIEPTRHRDPVGG